MVVMSAGRQENMNRQNPHPRLKGKKRTRTRRTNGSVFACVETNRQKTDRPKVKASLVEPRAYPGVFNPLPSRTRELKNKEYNLRRDQRREPRGEHNRKSLAVNPKKKKRNKK